jgi:hypothetical protein
MTDAPQRSDPIGDRYYRSLQIAGGSLNGLFWVAIVLSFTAILVDKASAPVLYDRGLLRCPRLVHS